MLGIISMGLAVAIQAAEEKVPEARGKIVVYAQFLSGVQTAGEERGLHIVDPATNTWTKIAEYPAKNGVVEMARFRVSPDATRLAFNHYQRYGSFVGENSVWLQDLRQGAAPRNISKIGGRPIWSPDGKQLLVVEVIGGGSDKPSQPSRFATWKIDDDGSHPVRLPIPESDMVADWSPDGQWLVGVSAGDEQEHRWEYVVMHPNGTGRRHLSGPGAGFGARFSPDGNRIAYVTASKNANSMQGSKSIWVVSLDGKDRRSIYMEPDKAYLEDEVTWSPDGKQLATILKTWTTMENGSVTPANPRLCIFDVEDRRMRIVPHPPATVLGHPEWR
jgi:Tol biopolymer transport system component